MVLLGLFMITACGEDTEPTANDCSGEVCQASAGQDETATSVPAAIHGTFEMEFTYAEPNSLPLRRALKPPLQFRPTHWWYL